MRDITARVTDIFTTLHAMPELGFAEFKTSQFLAGQLSIAGYQVTGQVGGTGVVGLLDSGRPGPTVALRADMDALAHMIGGQLTAVHSCGHDSNSSMVLAAAEYLAAQGLAGGKLKILFQPAEETLGGAESLIAAGAAKDIDILIGIHLRPVHEAKLGQATPALYHGAGSVMEAVITGASAHGARPHLGINAIDAAAAVVNAINAIHVNPAVPASVKVTKLHAGGAALNAIPDTAELGIDLRAQENAIMDELIYKTSRAVQNGAAAIGARASVSLTGGVPAAEYDTEIIDLAAQSIIRVLGADGLLPPLSTPGGEDFHFYAKHNPAIKATYIGIGADLAPGLHHPEMTFDRAALTHGAKILIDMAETLLGQKKNLTGR